MKITYRELLEVGQSINLLTTKNVTVEGMLKIIALNDEIAEVFKTAQPEYKQKFEELMQMHNVEMVDDVYNWAGHEKEEEITAVFNGLIDSIEVQLTKVNQHEESDVYALTHGLAVGQIKAFRTLLKK